MADCPNCEYHKQRAQIWRDEVYRLGGHPLPRKENSMTQDEIIEMARQAGFIDADWNIKIVLPHLEAFAHLVEEKEREACALICDAVTQDMSLGPLEKYRAAEIAKLIRARGKP